MFPREPLPAVIGSRKMKGRVPAPLRGANDFARPTGGSLRFTTGYFRSPLRGAESATTFIKNRPRQPASGLRIGGGFSQGSRSFVAAPLGYHRERRCRSWRGGGKAESLITNLDPGAPLAPSGLRPSPAGSPDRLQAFGDLPITHRSAAWGRSRKEEARHVTHPPGRKCHPCARNIAPGWNPVRGSWVDRGIPVVGAKGGRGRGVVEDFSLNSVVPSQFIGAG